MSVSDTPRTAALDRRFRDIDRGAPVRGERHLTAILPNGRVAWLRVTPALAPVSSVRDLASRVVASERERRAVMLRQRDRLARLVRSSEADARRLSEGKVRRAGQLRQRLAKGAARLERRFVKARDAHQQHAQRQASLREDAATRLGRRAFWDSLLLASAAPLFSAFGQAGDPFGEHNVALTASLLVWLAGDDVVDAIFGAAGSPDHAPHDTDIWSYLAPAGNLLTGWWLLSDRQHERFVTGVSSVATIPSPQKRVGPRFIFEERVDLEPHLAIDDFEDFRGRTDVPVVVTLREAALSATGTRRRARVEAIGASVSGGILTLRVSVEVRGLRGNRPTVPALFERLEVAWMLDARPTTGST